MSTSDILEDVGLCPGMSSIADEPGYDWGEEPENDLGTKSGEPGSATITGFAGLLRTTSFK
jgi:hypothetical protein